MRRITEPSISSFPHRRHHPPPAKKLPFRNRITGSENERTHAEIAPLHFQSATRKMLQIYPTEGPVLVSHDACLPRHRTVRSGARHRSSSAFPSSFSPFAQSPSPRSIRSGCGSCNSTTSSTSSTTRTISDSDSDRDSDSDDSSTDHSIHQHPDSLDDDQSEASSSNTTTTKNNSNNDDDDDNHVALFLSFSPESFASVTGDRRAWGSASRRSPMRRALDRIHRDTGGDCDGDGKNSRNEAPPCRFFRSKKGCRNGSRCRYQH